MGRCAETGGEHEDEGAGKGPIERPKAGRKRERERNGRRGQEIPRETKKARETETGRHRDTKDGWQETRDGQRWTKEMERESEQIGESVNIDEKGGDIGEGGETPD